MSDTCNISAAFGVSRRPSDANALLSLDLTASATLQLPAITASVDSFGASANLSLNFANLSLKLDGDGCGDGNYGIIQVTIKPTPPHGMSAELQLPPVSGGGYLAKDEVVNEMRGAFTANLGVLHVTAFAVLSLEQFSLLALMSAEFDPPLQLSFGFTLAGVGGLVGVNRGVDDDVLRAATSSGDLGQLMFPRDPIAEAPHLLEVASRCFPPRDGGLLIGPMVKIGWGTPTMLSATFALILSPSEGCAVILGRLAVTLPCEQAPLINLQAVVKGDIDQNGVRIDASLATSRILFMPVDGDLRLRMITAPQAQFALSAGGFHPGYPAPAGMEQMRPLSMAVSLGAILSLRYEAYLAITAASIQFGAKLELTAGFDGFGLHGFAQYDALLNVDPFGFEVRLEASVSVVCADFEVASVRLEGLLAGPAPWRINGHASIEVLFWDVDIDLPEQRWGEAPGLRVQAPDPLAVLIGALERSENWTAVSAEQPHLVVLRAGPGSATVLHPLGEVAFRQRSAPLDTELSRFGGVALEAPVTLSLSAAEGLVTVPEDFAPGEFFELDDNDRLSRTGYMKLPAGVDIARGAPLAPPAVFRNCDYEIKHLHNEFRWRRIHFDQVDEPVIHGLRARQKRLAPVFVEPRRPDDLAPAAGLGLTDAAGRTLSTAHAWELS